MVGSIRRLVYAALLLAAVYTVGRVLMSSLDSVSPPTASGGEGHAAALQHLTSAPKQIWNDEQGRYKWIAHAKLRQLTACLARGDCHPNADKVSYTAGRRELTPDRRLRKQLLSLGPG